jgi:hypothetical protein
LLRAGNAGSNTVAEHIEVTKLALAQLPRRARCRVLIRTDSGGGTHDFVTWLASPSRRLHYSVGMTITEDMQEAILALPGRVWEPAYDAGGEARPGAWVAELTGLSLFVSAARRVLPAVLSAVRIVGMGQKRLFVIYGPGLGPSPLNMTGYSLIAWKAFLAVDVVRSDSENAGWQNRRRMTMKS